MKLSEKLKNIRLENNLTLEELANLLNKYDGIDVSKGTISRWENGTREPKNTFVSAYAKEFNLDLNKLYDIDHVINNTENIIGLSDPIAKKIPILGTIACGEPIWAYENFDGYFVADTNIKADFIVKAKGDSMVDAGINDGDLVFLKKTPTVDNGRIGAVLIDNEATLKKVIKTDNAVILQPCNTSYQPIVLTENEEVMILGEMVGVYQNRSY